MSLSRLQKITRVELNIPDRDDARLNTRIHGDDVSICFETTDHEGNDVGDSFELTWPEIFDACRRRLSGE